MLEFLKNSFHFSLKYRNKLSSLLYPAFCLHCQRKLSRPDLLLCLDCASSIFWIDRHECCPWCLSPSLEAWKKRECCRKKKVWIRPHISLFLPFGAISDVWKLFVRYRDESLAKLWASLALFRFTQLFPSFFSAIVPIPPPFFSGGLEKSKEVMIGKQLSYLSNVPLCQVLKRDLFEVLKKKKNSSSLYGKRILLLMGDLRETSMVKEAREKIREESPEAIFSLAIIDSRGEGRVAR